MSEATKGNLQKSDMNKLMKQSENAFKESVTSFFRAIFHNKKSAFGFVIICFYVILAIIGPFVVPELKTDYANRLQWPSLQHWLGTDYSGRDTLGQFVLGTQNVLLIAGLAAVFSIFIAIIIGMTAGLLGGKTDKILMLITNVVLTVPSFPVMMVLSMVIEVENPVLCGVVLSIWSWAGLARSIRAQILSLKQRDFIEAARVMGMPTYHIIFREMLPNLTSFIAITMIGNVRIAINATVGLMYLGLIPFSSNHWGMMINLAMTTTGAVYGSSAIVFFLVPVIGLMIFQMGSYFLISGLDDALNPRLRNA